MFFYLMGLNSYYWEKLTFSKLVAKVNFSERKFEEMPQLWKAKRYKVYSGKGFFSERKLEEMHQLWRAIRYKVYSGKVFFGVIIIRCLCRLNRVFRFLLNYFVQEIKGFYQSSLGGEVNFRDIMNVYPNIFAKNWNFKKLRHYFVDERALITTALTSSCHWKTLLPFYLQKKRDEKAFLTLIVNYRKIAQKNKLCYSKQQ